MPAPFDNIVQHLFHQPSLHSVTVDELEQMAVQHPYFAAAHFLLLKKMQDTDHPLFTEQLHKTTIYFNNPLWLQYLLQPETVAHFTVSETAPFITSEPAVQPDQAVTEQYNGYSVETTDLPKDETTPQEELAVNTPEPPVQHTDEALAAVEKDSMMDVITDVFSDSNPLYHAVTADQQDDAPAEEMTAPQEGESIQDADEFMPENELPASTAEMESFDLPIQEGTLAADDEPVNTVAEQPTVDALPANEADYLPNDYSFNAADPETGEIGTPLISHHQDEMPLLKTIIETPAAKNDLLFEPYHTVDYFASQGIKLSKMETESKDTLGRQLKSFTEWLKSMKKLPQVSINKMLAQNEESKVVEDANHSIENKEVITEAMAEVFEKQGMREKAAEVYQKLSLLNPAKSAYFAARIDDLKQ